MFCSTIYFWILFLFSVFYLFRQMVQNYTANGGSKKGAKAKANPNANAVVNKRGTLGFTGGFALIGLNGPSVGDDGNANGDYNDDDDDDNEDEDEESNPYATPNPTVTNGNAAPHAFSNGFTPFPATFSNNPGANAAAANGYYTAGATSVAADSALGSWDATAALSPTATILGAVASGQSLTTFSRLARMLRATKARAATLAVRSARYNAAHGAHAPTGPAVNARTGTGAGTGGNNAGMGVLADDDDVYAAALNEMDAREAAAAAGSVSAGVAGQRGSAGQTGVSASGKAGGLSGAAAQLASATGAGSLPCLLKWVRKTWDDKTAADQLARAASAPVLPLPEFVFDAQRHMYGLPRLVHSKTLELLHALSAWRGSCAEAEFAAQCLEEARPLDELVLFLRTRAVVLATPQGVFYQVRLANSDVTSEFDNDL